MASRKCFQNDCALYWRNGTETLLCDDTVVLNIVAFQRQWVFHGEGFGSKYKPYFTWEMAEEFTHCLAGILRLFFVLFCPIAGLQHSIVKLKLLVSHLSWLQVDEAWKRVPTNSLLRDSVWSCLTQMRKCFEGMKHSLFIFISHSLLSFGGEVHCELETKTVSNFPYFLSSPTVTSQVLFPTIIQQFSRPLYDYEG